VQQVVWWFSFPCHGDHAARTPNHRRVGCAICTLADLQLGLATWDRQFDGERRQQWRTGGAVLTFTGRCVSHGEGKGREGPICM
jgi:hypothetical protein